MKDIVDIINSFKNIDLSKFLNAVEKYSMDIFAERNLPKWGSMYTTTGEREGQQIIIISAFWVANNCRNYGRFYLNDDECGNCARAIP